jgi:uncharacterized repeat protein (TIGR03803 family)
MLPDGSFEKRVINLRWCSKSPVIASVISSKRTFVSARRGRRIILLLLLMAAAMAVQPASAQTYTVLHTFMGAPDGGYPNPLIRDEQGIFYGTTYGGGLSNCPSDEQGACGTVFKMDGAGNETVLFNFPSGSGGSNPLAALVRDAAGNLFGTTQGNGAFGGDSVVFKIDPSGQETVLLTGGPNAESFDSPLALDAQGNLYGMSPYGGDPQCTYVPNGDGCGTLFKISSSGQFTVLHVFKGKDGVQPEGGLVLDAKGNLYGSAVHGGIYSCDYPGWGQPRGHGCGTIYKLDTNGHFIVLHTFTGPGDGSYPLGVSADSTGLYGIAESGGKIFGGNYIYGMGTVFKVDASGRFRVLFRFTPSTTVNNVYASHLMRDSRGVLYGLQQYNNGAHGGGCLFSVDNKGKYRDVYDFQGRSFKNDPDGAQPVGVLFGGNGDIYGSMNNGGFQPPPPGFCSTYGCGTIFRLSAH